MPDFQGGCQHNCHPENEGFCTCKRGYEQINGTHCADINECDTMPGICTQMCENVPSLVIGWGTVIEGVL